jgi:uncharacterized coiled-coil protein SlyX
MFEKLTLLEATSGGFSWELAATIIGVAALIVEAVIRIYIHNSKMKRDEKQTNNNQNPQNNLTDAEITYLKNVAQSVMNNSNKISNLEIKLKNQEDSIDDLKALIRDVERENFNSLTAVSDKIDVLKNILLEAKMNSKK